MYQLAIECSGQHGSAAILTDSQVIGSLLLPTDRSSVQSLAVVVKSLVKQVGRSPDFISVTHGPGSFTGLRVGLTTAKMLGLAWEIPLVAVDTLEVLTHQILHRQSEVGPIIIVPVINAFRQQVFTASWLTNPNSSIIPVQPTQVVNAELWTTQPLGAEYTANLADLETPPQELASIASKILVGGPGLQNYRPLERCGRSGLPVQQVQDVWPEAKWVGKVGWNRFQAGLTESPTTLTANYVRASAAEDKLDK